MKIFRTTFLFMLSIATISCSDKLTENRALEMVQECEKKNSESNALYADFFKDGDTVSYNALNIGQMKFYEKADLLEVKPVMFPVINSVMEYHVKIKPEAKKYTRTNNGKPQILLYRTKPVEILSIQEIPAYNSADAKVSYEMYDVPPFLQKGELQDDPKNGKRFTKDVKFSKTNNGWVLCDN